MSQTKIFPLMHFITFEDAVQRLQVSRDELMLMIKDETIKGYHYANEIYLESADVEALITSRTALQ